MTSACSRDPEIPTGLEKKDADLAAKKDGGACKLLTGQEAEVALNSPLDPISPESRPIVAGMKVCTLTAGNLTSSVSWGAVDKSAARKFERYRSWHDEYIQSVRGIGDKAVWDRKLGTLLVLEKENLIGVRLAVKEPPLKQKIERALYAEKTAKALATKILRRI